MEVEFNLVKDEKRDFSTVKLLDNIPENPFEKIDEKRSQFSGYFLVINTLVWTAIFSWKLPPPLALVFAGIIDLIILRFSAMRRRYKLFQSIADYTEPVFITALYPGDKTIYTRANKAEDLIANAWENNPYIPVPPVYPIYERDEGISEEEYKVRKLEIKRDKVKEYHLRVKTANPGYYYRFILGQEDYPWEPTAQK